MINVLHVTYDMRIGGTEMVIKSIIEGADKSKFNMSIFCLEHPLGPWGQELENNGTEISKYKRKEGFDFGAVREIRKCIKEFNIQIIHCHQYTPWVYGCLASIYTKAKVIFTEHGRFYPDVKHLKRRFINPVLSLFTSQVTAISKATAKALEEYEYISQSKTQVIYNGISTDIPKTTKDIRAELGISKDTLVLGSIARFDPIKNHKLMIDGFNELIETAKDAHLILVGDGECRFQIEALVEKYNLEDFVTLTGYISRPFDYLEAMDIFLLTSFSEGTSMTLLEAMRAGKPCIVTDVGGNREVVKDGVNGFVISSNCLKELKKAILDMEMERIRVFSQNSVTEFFERFTDKRMCNAFEKLYESI